jgi:hypothetical protein
MALSLAVRLLDQGEQRGEFVRTEDAHALEGCGWFSPRAWGAGTTLRRRERPPERSWPEPADRRIDEPENQPKRAAEQREPCKELDPFRAPRWVEPRGPAKTVRPTAQMIQP